MKKPVVQDVNLMFTSFAKGEESGFDFIYLEFHRPLVYFSNSIVNNKDAALDIVSEQFIKAWCKRSFFNSFGHLKSFLFAVTRNASIDFLREKKKQNLLTTASEPVELNIQDKMMQAETYRQVIHALENLPPQAREVVKLFYLLGEDYKEIARRLGLSASTVRVQKARALKLLRQSISWILLLLSIR